MLVLGTLLGVFLFFGVVGALYYMTTYNNLVTKNSLSEEGWSGVDVALKRRYDLIPNIVNTVKGYAKHEQDTLEKVIAQRNMCQNSSSIADRSANESILSGMLKTVFALSEAYPELKADKRFMELQNTLIEIEENIFLARNYYNATVRDLNIMIDQFPSNLVARSSGFKKRTFFELSNIAERENVVVKF